VVRILLTGSNGQLGNEFRILAESYPLYDFIFTDIGELDISNKRQVEEFIRENEPDVIINCAAYTAVDKAEDEPEKAMWLNRDAVSNLAGACDLFDIYFIHISTDYVFNGKKNSPYREDDIPSPSSIYGLTKLAGEEAMMACLQKGMIIRTSWLYSSFGNNFVKTILKKGAELGELKVVSDQKGTPTYARDLARTILEILPAAMSSQQLDIFHYSNEGECNWYEFAGEIISQAGIHCRIHPVPTDQYPTKATRPAYSVFDKGKIRERFGISIPDWKDSLRECMEVMGAGHRA
jgi:dTDP-4-dehydrorhamnose reductase